MKRIPPDPRAALIAEMSRRSGAALRRELAAPKARTGAQLLEARAAARQMRRETVASAKRHAALTERPGTNRGQVCVGPRVPPAWPQNFLQVFHRADRG